MRTTKYMSSVALSIVLLSGCAINMPVPIKDPTPSSISFTKIDAVASTELTFKDVQTANDKAQLLSGRIPMLLLYQGKPFDPVPWLARNTVREMAARGLPVKLAEKGNEPGSTKVLIKRVHIENHRLNGFSPFVTFTSLRADVLTPSGPRRITAYVKRGKVPVWSFDEVIDPTYNDPLSILTKELAAKLNQHLLGQAVSDAQVSSLIEKIRRDGGARDEAYLDVYQLGFGNNLSAVPELLKLTSHPSEYIRLAAISSLGILKAIDQHDFLVARYQLKDGLWQDRAMALKAIGDLGTEKSQAYLQNEWTKFEKRNDTEALWLKEIIALYLDQENSPPGISVQQQKVPASVLVEAKAKEAIAMPSDNSGKSDVVPTAAALPERQLTGEEIRAHVMNLRKVKASASRIPNLRLDFSANGSLAVQNISGRADDHGSYRIKSADSQICLYLNSAVTGNRSLKNLHDCYRVYETGRNQFRWRSVSDNTFISYELI